ncbi:MAG TPA: hypothetical protein VFD74_00145 [Thermoleophilia bacterium]|nr:hypothetical protein [Thermoleophilia bacterium]
MAKKSSSPRRARSQSVAPGRPGFRGFWDRLSSRQRGQFTMSAGASVLLILFLIVRALFF